MIPRSELVAALIAQVQSLFPQAQHYKGKLPENYSTPAFLYLPVTNVRRRVNAFLEEVTEEIQILYFGTQEEDGVDDFDEKSQTEDMLCTFLQKGYFTVSDRNIHFSYETGEQDGHLSILLRLRYQQETVREEETAELTETIYLTEKEG